MKTPYLDDLVRFHGCDYSNHELEQVKQALEPKFTEKEFENIINGYPMSEIKEILEIKFKEREIELVEGTYYFVKCKKSGVWEWLQYSKKLNWSNQEIREYNNPPT